MKLMHGENKSLQTLPITRADQAVPERFDASKFLGLAPFLRMSIAGEEWSDIAQILITRAQQTPDDAVLWMNLFHCHAVPATH